MKLILWFFFLFSSPLVSLGETTNNSEEEDNSRPPFEMSQYGMGPACNNFILPNGSLGTYGTALFAAINKVNGACFYENFNPINICPNFHKKKFSKTKKQQFIAFLFATIAYYESSCDPEATATGENDLAVGLFQLEDTKAARKAAGRSAKFCATEREVVVKDITFQMECAASTFETFHCRKGIPPGQCLPNPENPKKPFCGYWQKLNRPNRAITTTAMRFPGCR